MRVQHWHHESVRSSWPTSTTGSSFTVYRVKATKMERVASQGHSRGAGRAKTWSSWISVAQSLSLLPQSAEITSLFSLLSCLSIRLHDGPDSATLVQFYGSPQALPHTFHERNAIWVCLFGPEQVVNNYQGFIAKVWLFWVSFFILTENYRLSEETINAPNAVQLYVLHTCHSTSCTWFIYRCFAGCFSLTT